MIPAFPRLGVEPAAYVCDGGPTGAAFRAVTAVNHAKPGPGSDVYQKQEQNRAHSRARADAVGSVTPRSLRPPGGA